MCSLLHQNGLQQSSKKKIPAFTTFECKLKGEDRQNAKQPLELL